MNILTFLSIFSLACVTVGSRRAPTSKMSTMEREVPSSLSRGRRSLHSSARSGFSTRGGTSNRDRRARSFDSDGEGEEDCFKGTSFGAGDPVTLYKPGTRLHGRPNRIRGCGQTPGTRGRICVVPSFGCWSAASLRENIDGRTCQDREWLTSMGLMACRSENGVPQGLCPDTGSLLELNDDALPMAARKLAAKGGSSRQDTAHARAFRNLGLKVRNKNCAVLRCQPLRSEHCPPNTIYVKKEMDQNGCKRCPRCVRVGRRGDGLDLSTLVPAKHVVAAASVATPDLEQENKTVEQPQSQVMDRESPLVRSNSTDDHDGHGDEDPDDAAKDSGDGMWVPLSTCHTVGCACGTARSPEAQQNSPPASRHSSREDDGWGDWDWVSNGMTKYLR